MVGDASSVVVVAMDRLSSHTYSEILDNILFDSLRIGDEARSLSRWVSSRCF
jgi:hypothetical protein